MTAARAIIQSALSLRLNRLSPGETMDADTGALCLMALNEVVGELNGGQWGMWREVLTASIAPVTGAAVSITTAFALPAGSTVLGVTYSSGGQDTALGPITVQQYHELVGDKATTGAPAVYAFDGHATLHMWPAPVAQSLTVRHRVAVSEFADLDTEYTLPPGYPGWLSSLVAERVAAPLVGGLTADVARAAAVARRAITARNVVPGIINPSCVTGAAAFFAGA